MQLNSTPLFRPTDSVVDGNTYFKQAVAIFPLAKFHQAIPLLLF